MKNFFGIMDLSSDKYMTPLEYEIYYNPFYTIAASFFTGVLLSPWAWGIVYVFIFLIIWEIGVWWYCRYNKTLWNPELRLSVLLAYVFGFLVGRSIIGDDDHDQSIREFKANMKCYLKGMDMMDDSSDSYESVENSTKNSTEYSDSSDI